MSGVIGSIVTILFQSYFYDQPDSIGYQACSLEAVWPGILKAMSPEDQDEDSDSDDGEEKLRRPFIERVPLSAWSATNTHVSDLTHHSTMTSHLLSSLWCAF